MLAGFRSPLEHLQQEIAAEALQRAGAPFSLDDAAQYREGVRRVWGFYRAGLARAQEKPLREAARVFDNLLYERKREEYIDDPLLADEKREKLIENLDSLNRLAHSYDWFFRALEKFIAKAPVGELTVLDIGSGHGAFPIRLADKRSLGGRTLSVIGSDISPLYVEKARDAARKQRVRVEFRVLDALKLDRMEERFDIITSSQTIHHFSPAFLSELMARVRANAKVGVIFFDDRRSALTLLGATVGTLAVSRNPRFLHDGVVSVRRMYSPAELEMLARCAPGGEIFHARNLGPIYTATEAVTALTR
jgi:2-polyprenyl-3-methyl-5-hydroxy-6-metoxy-1,4-benzoquinol methylase